MANHTLMRWIVACTAALLTCGSHCAFGQSAATNSEPAADSIRGQAYPTRPIRLIIPLPPGGGADFIGRAVGLKLSEQFGQSVVADNRGGASGAIAGEIAARAAPDDYTLFLAGLKRSSIVPDIPTVAEGGFPGFDTNQWYALLGPARLPTAIVRRLHDETLRAMNVPNVRAKLDQQGFEIEGSTPEACRDYIRSELAKWAKLAAAAGIKAESIR